MMKWICVVLLLGVVVLGGCDIVQNPSPNISCTKSEVKTNISWDGGIVLILNHCAVRDTLAGSAAAAGITSLMAADCPNIICKGAAAALTAFLVSQAVELQGIDNQCGNQGAILEIGSFKDQTLWIIKPICGAAPGHLMVTDNNQGRENKLACGPTSIYLSFVLQNTGEQALRWRLAIYYGNTAIQPLDLRAYISEGGIFVRTGRKQKTYNEEGLIGGEQVTVAVTGSVDRNQIKKYGQITLSYLVIGGDGQNPPSVAIKCS